MYAFRKNLTHSVDLPLNQLPKFLTKSIFIVKPTTFSLKSILDGAVSLRDIRNR